MKKKNEKKKWTIDKQQQQQQQKAEKPQKMEDKKNVEKPKQKVREKEKKKKDKRRHIRIHSDIPPDDNDSDIRSSTDNGGGYSSDGNRSQSSKISDRQNDDVTPYVYKTSDDEDVLQGLTQCGDSDGGVSGGGNKMTNQNKKNKATQPPPMININNINEKTKYGFSQGGFGTGTPATKRHQPSSRPTHMSGVGSMGVGTGVGMIPGNEPLVRPHHVQQSSGAQVCFMFGLVWFGFCLHFSAQKSADFFILIFFFIETKKNANWKTKKKHTHTHNTHTCTHICVT